MRDSIRVDTHVALLLFIVVAVAQERLIGGGFPYVCLKATIGKSPENIYFIIQQFRRSNKVIRKEKASDSREVE